LSHAADRRPHGGGAYAESGFIAFRTSRIAAECRARAALASRVAILGAGAHDRGDLLFADGRSANSRRGNAPSDGGVGDFGKRRLDCPATARRAVSQSPAGGQLADRLACPSDGQSFAYGNATADVAGHATDHAFGLRLFQAVS